MTADIEKIKAKFGVGQKDKELTEPVISENYGYSSHTFEIYTGDRRAGVITVSDMGEDIKDTIRDFLENLIKNERLYETDNIKIILTAAYPSVDNDDDKDGLVYEGGIHDYYAA